MSSNSSGYAYVEILIAALLVSTALSPAAEAFRDVATSSVTQRDLVAERYAAMGTLETVLAEPFHVLNAEAGATMGLTESSFSEPMGTPNRHIVMVAPYDIDDADSDGNPLTGTDAGVVWVGVTVEGLGLSFQSTMAEAL